MHAFLSIDNHLAENIHSFLESRNCKSNLISSQETALQSCMMLLGLF